MNIRRPKRTERDLLKALAEIGGEPLEGSGFEVETPAQEFSAEPDAPEFRQ
jgi:hypothetical protein